jgi:hypothetical protein
MNPNSLPISKVSGASIAQPNTINNTIVSTATTPELELSQLPGSLSPLSPLVPAVNDIDEGQLSEPNDHASDSGFEEDDNDDVSALLPSYLEPVLYDLIPYAPTSGLFVSLQRKGAYNI